MNSPPRVTRRADGPLRADPTRLSFAHFPYEIQLLIFKEASHTQIFLVDASLSGIRLGRPSMAGLAHTCRLSREVYTKGKTRHRFTSHTNPADTIRHYYWWINSAADLFVLHGDAVPAPIRHRHPSAYLHMGIDRSVMRNVAVDLQYLGPHPRCEPLTRILHMFPAITSLVILAPLGPPQTPTPEWAAETLVLSKPLHRMQVVAPPGQDDEIWGAILYQVRRVLAKILVHHANGFAGRTVPVIKGYYAVNQVASACLVIGNGGSDEMESDEDESVAGDASAAGDAAAAVDTDAAEAETETATDSTATPESAGATPPGSTATPPGTTPPAANK